MKSKVKLKVSPEIKPDLFVIHIVAEPNLPRASVSSEKKKKSTEDLDNTPDKMPTNTFQCEVLVFKEGTNDPVPCDFKVPEHQTVKDAQLTYQNHLEVHKMNGRFLT